ncbi:hypothetical protein BDW22DRAFT_309330 [Trametopsis cervina]|nr:hypothetical protein BDW22DRAFT_309330 [Trametopsis cervina]
MVSLRPRPSTKRQRVSSAPRPKQKQPPIHASTERKKPLSRFFATLRLSALSKLGQPNTGVACDGAPAYMNANNCRRIIRVSELKFDAVDRSPIVISRPFPLGGRPPQSKRPLCNEAQSSNDHGATSGEATPLEPADSADERRRDSKASFESWIEVSLPGSRPALRVLSSTPASPEISRLEDVGTAEPHNLLSALSVFAALSELDTGAGAVTEETPALVDELAC